MTKCRLILAIAVLFGLLRTGSMAADVLGKEDYDANCAECHGIDGKGSVPGKRMVTGYVSVDLTQLSKRNDGQYPRQQIYDAIDGRQRFAAHCRGDMPRWGTRYELERGASLDTEQDIRRRISALVDYIETLQKK